MLNLGVRIKELRNKNGFTQEELAEKLGVKKVSIQKYENGSIVNLKFDTIKKLADIFEVNPSFLVGWDKFDKELNVTQIKEEVKIYEEIQNRYGYVGVELAKVFDDLNEEGKRKVLFYAEDIVENPKYKSDTYNN